MFGERTSSEASDARGAEGGRFGHALSLLLVGLAVALAALVLGSRRGGDATLEPPF